MQLKKEIEEGKKNYKNHSISDTIAHYSGQISNLNSELSAKTFQLKEKELEL